MGYTTHFTGQINLSRKLTFAEAKELLDIEDNPDLAEQKTGISGYMQWVPSATLDGIVWNQGEKFYDYIKYMDWVCGWLKERGISANGELHWRGEDMRDTGRIVVTDNVVKTFSNDIKVRSSAPLTIDMLQAMALEQVMGGAA